jgi:5'-3' exonuclease
MLLAVDADSLVYSHGFPNDGKPLGFATKSLNGHLERMVETLGDATAEEIDVKVFLGGKGNFRNELAVSQPYKGTRTSRRPEHYDALRGYMDEWYDTTFVDGMEADDAVSLLLWEDYQRCETQDDYNVVVASLDKDLRNTPGMHLHSKTLELTWVTEQEASDNFHTQLLKGDKTDNIRGLPRCSVKTVEEFGLNKAALKGVGEVTAGIARTSWCHPLNEIAAFDIVYDWYCEWGKEEGLPVDFVNDYLTEQGRLLWMSRELDEDFEPVLWVPPYLKERY